MTYRSAPVGGPSATGPGSRTPRYGAGAKVRFPSGQRAPTAAEVLAGPPEDKSLQRIQHTPRVFQSSKECFAHNRRRELRLNLLPSILRTREESDEGAARKAAGTAAASQVDGEFYRDYRERLEERAKVENDVGVFLERDDSFPATEWDPSQVAAKSCSVLQDLVAEKLKKFRRPQESFVNTTSELLFSHTDQGFDLEELTKILTLDIERREQIGRSTEKRPGFLSLQFASRVPLVFRDPVGADLGIGGNGVKEVRSERMCANDLYVIRLDLAPGEVRQLSFGLAEDDFRNSPLASRMAALVDPEKGILARLVRTMRSKQLEAKSLASVLNDVLRDLPDDLPACPDPALQPQAQDEKLRPQRLEALIAEPRRTLSRLVQVGESLAALVAPLLPDMANALDRLVLACVREVDRLAMRCHKDYERVRKLWQVAEGHRRALATAENASEKADGVTLTRLASLKAELASQDALHTSLLHERNSLQIRLDEEVQTSAALRGKVKELQKAVDTLQKEKRARSPPFRSEAELLSSPGMARQVSGDSGTGRPTPENTDGIAAAVESVAVGPSEPVSATNLPSSSDGRPSERPGDAGPSSPKSAASPAPVSSQTSPRQQGTKSGTPAAVLASTRLSQVRVPRRGARGSDLLHHKALFDTSIYTVPKGTQTEREYVFCERMPLQDEISLEDFEHVFTTAGRLFKIMSRYEWNSQTSTYLLKTGEPDGDSDEAPAPAKDKQTAQWKRLQALHSLKVKVEKAHSKAYVCMMEEQVARLQSCAKEGFEDWISQACKEMGSMRKSVTSKPVVPEELWAAIKELVHTEAMRRRVRELEDHLSTLLPLAERAKVDRHGAAQGGGDNSFWRRIMRAVRQGQNVTRRSSLTGMGRPTLVTGAGRRTSTGALLPGTLQQVSMDEQMLAVELRAIWSSVTRSETEHLETKFKNKVQAQQALQASVKAFYLRKTGRSKYVESSTINLCRAVLQYCQKDTRAALFAVMCDVQPATTMMGTSIPKGRRTLAGSTFGFDPATLTDLPLDAPYAMANLMRDLEMLHRRLANARGQDGSLLGDPWLPFQSVLSTAYYTVVQRSRRTAALFESYLFRFVEFTELNAPESEQANSEDKDGKEEADGDKSEDADDAVGTRTDDKGGGDSKEQDPSSSGTSSMEEMLFVSHTLERYLAQQAMSVGRNVGNETQGEMKARLLEEMWEHILAKATPTGVLRKSLSLRKTQSAPSERAGQLTVEHGCFNMPAEVVTRAFRQAHAELSASGQEARNLDEEIEISLADVSALAEAWKGHGGEWGVRIRESHVLWAALWALAGERIFEMDLMGQLFQLYDTSGDGWLQFEEFVEFVRAIYPEVSRRDAEELFLCGAEEVTGDMTKEVFLNLVMRLGMTSEVDHVQSLVTTKHSAMYGERALDNIDISIDPAMSGGRAASK